MTDLFIKHQDGEQIEQASCCKAGHRTTLCARLAEWMMSRHWQAAELNAHTEADSPSVPVLMGLFLCDWGRRANHIAWRQPWIRGACCCLSLALWGEQWSSTLLCWCLSLCCCSYIILSPTACPPSPIPSLGLAGTQRGRQRVCVFVWIASFIRHILFASSVPKKSLKSLCSLIVTGLFICRLRPPCYIDFCLLWSVWCLSFLMSVSLFTWFM